MTYDRLLAFADAHDGHRVRFTYRHGGRTTGVLTVRQVGVHRDVLHDGRGGLFFEGIVAAEVMRSGRYHPASI